MMLWAIRFYRVRYDGYLLVFSLEGLYDLAI
jgi:hypothetical protein